MDGDNTAKTFDAGANSATKGGAEFTDSIHEGAHQAVCPLYSPSIPPLVPFPLPPLPTKLTIFTSFLQSAAGDKATGHGSSIFDKSGALGKQFTGMFTTSLFQCPSLFPSLPSFAV